MDSGTRALAVGILIVASVASACTSAGAPEEIVWETCGENRCASLAVPVDRTDPTEGTTSIRIMHASARRAARGTIVFFPGGPGGSAIDQGEGGILTALGQLGLRDTNDVLFVDPRGTGHSDPIDCVGSADLDRLIELDLVGAVETGALEPFDDELRGWQERCRGAYGARLDHLGAAEVADDLEHVRALLGVDVLDGLGVSYGTRLAAQFAERHGEHVRAFVLDSTVTPSAPSLREWFEAEATDYAAALERFFDACGASAECPFHGGAGAGPVRVAYDGLLDRLATEVVVSGPQRVRELHLETGVNRGLAGGDAMQLGQMLADAERGEWEPILRAADDALGRRDPTTDTLIETHFAILANDVSCPAGFDRAEAVAWSRAVLATAPRTGLVQIAEMLGACLHPIGGGDAPLALGPSSSPPLLVLGGAHDPATPLHEARAMVDALANGSYLVTYEGDGHFYTPRSLCIVGVELAYLSHPDVAPSATSCQ